MCVINVCIIQLIISYGIESNQTAALVIGLSRLIPDAIIVPFQEKGFAVYMFYDGVNRNNLHGVPVLSTAHIHASYTLLDSQNQKKILYPTSSSGFHFYRTLHLEKDRSVFSFLLTLKPIRVTNI